MSKKFWRKGSVSKLLQAPKEVLKHGFFGGEGRGGDAQALLEKLPEIFPSLDSGLQVLDREFPVREGASRVDYLLRSADGELIFSWVKPKLNSETISKVLPDYDWVQKNQALWPHLFPDLLQQRSLRMKVWLISFNIEAEIQCLLSYLSGIQLKLFKARRASAREGGDWRLSPWEARSGRTPVTTLPSSPSVLSLVPGPQPPAPLKAETAPLISPEELQDLIGLGEPQKDWTPDEITDPFFVLKREGD